VLILINDGSYSTFSEDKKRTECELYKKTDDLKKEDAFLSLLRFKRAKQICEKYAFNEGAQFMQNYVEIYNMCRKQYCN